MKHTLLIFMLALQLAFYPLLVVAANDEDFDPNFLISDEEMQGSQSMNRADVQAFLNDKGGRVGTMHFEDIEGVSRDAADIIVRAAREHNINPKYLLVKLQKEQSLLTDNSPTQKQLDWATGYGICDACSMSDPTLQKHKGFGTQVDSAAGIIRWYYDNYRRESWIKRPTIAYNIDGQSVHPANHATAFLYTYTPHILGNKNFWKLWQRWFDQVYPDGTLMKADNANVVYLIRNKQKHPFASYGALTSRFDPKMIITVSSSELANYADGSAISIPNYAIVKVGGTYYLLDDDTIRPFANFTVVKNLGYHPDEILEASSAEIAGYTVGDRILGTSVPLGRLIKVKENNSFYFLRGNQYFPIYDKRIAAVRYPNHTAEVVSATELADLVSGPAVLLKDGTLFGIEGENSIYVVEHNKKRHIASEDVFNGLGYKWDNIVWLNTFAGIAHETGQPVYLNRTISKTTQIADVSDGTTGAPDPDSKKNEKMITTPAAKTIVAGPVFDTDVDGYIVMDYDTEKVLSGKNIDVQRPIASLTKVISAYQLLREGMNPEGSVVYDAAKHKSMYHRYNIGDGDRVLNKDLMSAMLISSLNTPSHMLVSSVDKSEKAFMTRLNAQMKEWGYKKTSLVEPSGAELANVSTAKEYALLFKRATRNATMQEKLGASSYSYSKVANPSNSRKSHFDDHSNALVHSPGLPYTILASKTGYLEESGDGLAMLVQRNTDGKKFILITMGNPFHWSKFDEPERFANWAMQTF
jgi:hypothetical protein